MQNLQKTWTSDFSDVINARPTGHVLAVCLHPALDVTVYTRDGKETGRCEVLGGKAINLARMLHTLGANVTLLAPNDCDGQTSALLADCGYDCELVPTELSLRRNYKYIDQNGTHRECNDTAKIISQQDFQQVIHRIVDICCLQQTDCRIRHFSHVALCGSFPQGVEKDVYKSLTEQLRAYNIPCVTDASGNALSLAVQAKPLLVKPNLQEFCNSFAQDVSMLKTTKDVCNAILAAYENTGVSILCSMDQRGAIYAGSEGVYTVQVPVVKQIQSFAGAGDTMLAAFIHARMLCNAPIEQSLRFASSAATAKVRLPANLLPNAQQIFTEWTHTEIRKGGA